LQKLQGCGSQKEKAHPWQHGCVPPQTLESHLLFFGLQHALTGLEPLGERGIAVGVRRGGVVRSERGPRREGKRERGCKFAGVSLPRLGCARSRTVLK
jgi:hypothetical protein